MSKRLVRLISVLLVASLIAIACSGNDGFEATPTGPDAGVADSGSGATDGDDGSGGSGADVDLPTTDDDTDDDSGTPGASTGSLRWATCGELECADLDVPVDHLDDDGSTLRIAVGRLPARGEPIGVLVVNPGGPGGSGLEFLAAFSSFFPSDLRVFDIVSFDPRGVGDSEPSFRCGDDGEQLSILSSIDDEVDTPAETGLAEAAAALCVETMGEVAGLLHTEYVARDMDVLRSALGEEQISYLGFSYGSVIGTWYASLFPDRVRAMVLDGASDPIDPSSTTEERVASDLDEIETFGVLLDRAIAACDDPGCVMWNDGDPVQLYLDAVAKFDLVAAETEDNPLAGPLGLITTLYGEDSWFLLYQGVADLALADDPTVFASLARFQIPDPSQPSFTAHVNCLDDWVHEGHVTRVERLADSTALTAVLEEEQPLLAALGIETVSTCPFYDQFAPAPLSIELDGGDVPILVIGNPNDPATPFVESEGLALDTLSNGRLLEVEHPSHTVYPDNDCVNNWVHAVLIDLVNPSERRVSC